MTQVRKTSLVGGELIIRITSAALFEGAGLNAC
jgi:hypothetical protein